MEAMITNFRMQRHHHSSNQMILLVDKIDDKKKAHELVGKTVVFNTGKKEIKGKISNPHGNKGAVRVLFEQGMPGQAIGKKVKIV